MLSAQRRATGVALGFQHLQPAIVAVAPYVKPCCTG